LVVGHGFLWSGSLNGVLGDRYRAMIVA